MSDKEWLKALIGLIMIGHNAEAEILKDQIEILLTDSEAAIIKLEIECSLSSNLLELGTLLMTKYQRNNKS